MEKGQRSRQNKVDKKQLETRSGEPQTKSNKRGTRNQVMNNDREKAAKTLEKEKRKGENKGGMIMQTSQKRI